MRRSTGALRSLAPKLPATRLMSKRVTVIPHNSVSGTHGSLLVPAGTQPDNSLSPTPVSSAKRNRTTITDIAGGGDPRHYNSWPRADGGIWYQHKQPDFLRATTSGQDGVAKDDRIDYLVREAHANKGRLMFPEACIRMTAECGRQMFDRGIKQSALAANYNARKQYFNRALASPKKGKASGLDADAQLVLDTLRQLYATDPSLREIRNATVHAPPHPHEMDQFLADPDEYDLTRLCPSFNEIVDEKRAKALAAFWRKLREGETGGERKGAGRKGPGAGVVSGKGRK